MKISTNTDVLHKEHLSDEATNSRTKKLYTISCMNQEKKS